MTDDIKKLIAEARTSFVSDWGAAFGLIDRMADALEAEHWRAEGHRQAFLDASRGRFEALTARDAFHDKALGAIHAMNAAQDERDALRTAIREVMEHEMSCYGKSETWIFLSRAIDTKEKP